MVKIIVEYKIYIVKDRFKHLQYAVTDDECNDIQICNMKDKKGNDLYFESEAYHLDTWCRNNKLSLTIINKKESFEV